jgi:hypothetical protein
LGDTRPSISVDPLAATYSTFAPALGATIPTS